MYLWDRLSVSDLCMLQTSAAPNLLQITVHSAADLTGSAMEAFVEVEVGNLRKQSKVIHRF
jgi:hypothetical protein